MKMTRQEVAFSKNQKLPIGYRVEWWESDEHYHWVIDNDTYSCMFSDRFMCYKNAWFHHRIEKKIKRVKMGLYDSVWVECPNCTEINKFQTKSGDCFLKDYRLEDCPDDVLEDVNRHSPIECACKTLYAVDINIKKAVIIN